MRFWFSPFPLEPSLLKSLSDWGLQQDEDARHPPCELLLLYEPPHALAQPALSGLAVAELTRSYRRLIAMARAGATAVASARLLGMGPTVMRDWLEEGKAPTAARTLPDASPIAALLTLAVLDRQPALLDAYLDLELQAELLGCSVDSDYVRRLQRVLATIDPDRLLRLWQAPVLAASRMLARSRVIKESFAQRKSRILELEQEVKAAREFGDELRQERERLQNLLDDCRAERENSCRDLTTLQEERQTLLAAMEEQYKLIAALKEQALAMEHQIREAHVELERTFLTSQRGLDLGRQCQVELLRAETLLRRLP